MPADRIVVDANVLVYALYEGFPGIQVLTS
jgi:predicted nucleic acid-binding protein